MPSADPTQLELSIHGRVQGVSYRASMRDEARARSLTGWVKNEADGTVRALAQGDRQALQSLLAWCHEGPPGARVDAIDTRWADPTERFDRFEVRG